MPAFGRQSEGNEILALMLCFNPIVYGYFMQLLIIHFFLPLNESS